MNPFHLKATSKMPEVLVDFQKSTILIKGRSMCDESAEVFEKIIELIETNPDSFKQHIAITVALEYCNSQCTKGIYALLKLANVKSEQLTINWHYEADDEHIYDMGEEIKSSFDCDFILVKI